MSAAEQSEEMLCSSSTGSPVKDMLVRESTRGAIACSADQLALDLSRCCTEQELAQLSWVQPLPWPPKLLLSTAYMQVVSQCKGAVSWRDVQGLFARLTFESYDIL